MSGSTYQVLQRHELVAGVVQVPQHALQVLGLPGVVLRLLSGPLLQRVAPNQAGSRGGVLAAALRFPRTFLSQAAASNGFSFPAFGRWICWVPGAFRDLLRCGDSIAGTRSARDLRQLASPAHAMDGVIPVGAFERIR